jgi:hypothetical protein
MPQMCIGICLYIIHYTLRELLSAYNKTPMRWYFGDILALIVCIPIIINFQIIFKIRRKYYITLVDILIYFILFAFYFEIIGPIYKNNLTSDPVDIIAYLIGGILLYYSQEYNFENKIKRRINKIYGRILYKKWKAKKEYQPAPHAVHGVGLVCKGAKKHRITGLFTLRRR